MTSQSALGGAISWDSEAQGGDAPDVTRLVLDRECRLDKRIDRSARSLVVVRREEVFDRILRKVSRVDPCRVEATRSLLISPPMTATSRYVHGTQPEEQRRLAELNSLINQSTLEALRPMKGECALDVGSGLGQMARAIAKATGERVLGIERSPEQIEKAVGFARADGEESLVELRAGDALQMPLALSEWGTFDLAFTRFLLEHVPQPQLVVNAMARAVKAGGRVVLCDDDHDAFKLWPEPPGLHEVWSAYVQSYATNGNDGLIGRKLVALLYEAGLEPKRIAMPMFGACAGETMFPAYVTNLLVVLDGARSAIVATGAVTATKFQEVRLAIQDWSQLPDATIWYTMFLAEARKP